MLRTFELILIAAMLAAAAVTYTIKYDAERQIAVIAKLQRQINFERDTITLLRADWALMTQPGRLQALVGIYSDELQIEPTEAAQYAASVDEIPEREPDDIQKLISGSNELLASGVLELDSMTTGSIKRNGAGH